MKAEEAYAKDGTLPDPNSTDNPEFKIVLGLIRDGLAADPKKVLARCAGLRWGALRWAATVCAGAVFGWWRVVWRAPCKSQTATPSTPSASSPVAPHGREDCGRV